MKRSLKAKTGRRRTGKTKCRQIGRVPDVVWRNVMRGFYASNSQNFTKWATKALLNQAKADLKRRLELERVANEILNGTLSGQDELAKSRRNKLKLLLAEKSDVI
jgi:hypothetical protein